VSKEVKKIADHPNFPLIVALWAAFLGIVANCRLDHLAK